MGGKGGGKGGGRPAQQPVPSYAIPRNTTVIVRDLQKGTEHNGKTGKIKDWDAAKSRYEVELEGDTTLSLRPSNVTQLCTIVMTGIESQPEINGQTADICNFNAGRYVVKFKKRLSTGQDVVGLRPSNVILSKSTRVVVQGLSNEQFNGLMGEIVEVDQDALKYTVALQNGKHIKIKLDNVLC